MSQISNTSTSKKQASKKTVVTVAAEPTVEELQNVSSSIDTSDILKIPDSPKIKVLAAVPACHLNHVQFKEQVSDAVKANFNISNVDVSLSVWENADADGFQIVVDAMNKLVERVLKENFDYLWIVEADVSVPPTALTHLLSVDADVVSGAVPFPFAMMYPVEKYGAAFAVYQDLVVVGYFSEPPTTGIRHLYLKDFKGKVLFSPPQKNMYTGTGCILIKRCAFEVGVRFKFGRSGEFDQVFWRDAAAAGFKLAVDGFVVCKTLA